MAGKEDIAAPRVLIVTDRLELPAKCLTEYLHDHTEFRVVGIVSDSEGVLRVARENHFDILIIAGYLSNVNTYGVLYKLDEIQNDYMEVHWATLSQLVLGHDAVYHIRANFDRNRPFGEFASYLEEMLLTLCESSADGTKFVRPRTMRWSYRSDGQTSPTPITTPLVKQRTMWQRFINWLKSLE